MMAGVTDLSARYPMLASLDGPAPLHDMDDAALAALAQEMRQAIIATVSTTGGHLGSSLGTIELSIALHAELNSPRDRILWDVGHQAYGHKLLTGRLGEFGTLRQHDGLSGFLRRAESEHDIMGAGTQARASRMPWDWLRQCALRAAATAAWWPLSATAP